MDFSTLASGIRNAVLRQDGTAHNIANLNTEGFHSLHTVQSEAPEGGSHACVVRRPDEGVFLATEFVEQLRAEQQLAASARVIRVQQEMLGTILDVFG
jgi:flagellar hook-associated protein FlgK